MFKYEFEHSNIAHESAPMDSDIAIPSFAGTISDEQAWRILRRNYVESLHDGDRPTIFLRTACLFISLKCDSSSIFLVHFPSPVDIGLITIAVDIVLPATRPGVYHMSIIHFRRVFLLPDGRQAPRLAYLGQRILHSVSGRQD